MAAVLSSQFAAIAAVGGFLLFGERLQRHQVLGVVVIAVGITVLSALQVDAMADQDPHRARLRNFSIIAHSIMGSPRSPTASSS